MRSCLHAGADTLPSEQSCTVAVDCEDLGEEVLGSSLSLPNCDHCSLLNCRLATCPTSLVPGGFAEELRLSPCMAFPACFVVFLLWNEKSFRPCCSNPGYGVVTYISKRAVTLVLLFVLWWPSGLRVLGIAETQNKKVGPCLKAQCCHIWLGRFDTCPVVSLP